MSLLKDFKAKGKTEAMKLVERSISDIQALQTLYAELFPYAKLSDAQSDFKSFATSAVNDNLTKAVNGTLDQLEAASQTSRTLEYFITLHIPKIEDGGNFGVGVQLDLVKKLNEMQDCVKSAIEDLLGYQSARADALGKLNLPSTSSTVTKSSGTTTTDGKKEEKTSETTEEKLSSSTQSGPAFESRLASVAAVDALYYSKAKAYYQTCIVAIMSVMDFVDKNREKLLEPKGRGGSTDAFTGMY
ncbi:proteasome activator pa28 beta subunit [Nitzschia inconspicua]|uniref:Proteasome activator pa28 beta subunit n=1 Tax=Nitzschia inconspicua TaxID=303405 RepID=A0A9K3KI08_9STRA|nr:proteasome activator pa28 beta subunit [Nitzschia inconspicua]